MPEYSINRWDSVILKNNTYPMPMIYIKPDESFYKKINQEILVYIKNSNSKYDQRPILGYVYNSAYFPDNRPNFWNETKSIIIVLFTNWLGYPDSLGKVFIQENTIQENSTTEKIENQDSKRIDKVFPQQIESYNNENNNSFPIISIILVVCFVILAIILMFK